jgi:hypothetical protein
MQMADSTNPAEAKASAWKGTFAKIAMIGAFVVCFVGGKLLGAPFWMPIIGVAVAWTLLTKWKVVSWLVPVLAIVIGHAAWIAVGGVLLIAMGRASVEAQIYAVGEVLIVTALIFWVLKKKSVAALAVLIAFEVLGLAAVLLNDSDLTRDLATALVMHGILRVTGIAAAIYAIVIARRQPRVGTS